MTLWRDLRAEAFTEAKRLRSEARGTVPFDPDKARQRAADAVDLYGDISNPTFGKYANPSHD